MPEPAPPRVFISYSHDSETHADQVLALAERLLAEGVDASIDQYIQSPPEGWPAWCEAEIRKADFVLMVCTETYLRRVNREEEAGKGHGALWEARLIRQYLYDSGSVSSKFVPVLFADGLHDYVPTPVKGGSIYRVQSDEGYEGLYRLLTNQPRVRKGVLGKLRRLPERQRVSLGEPPAELVRKIAEPKEGVSDRRVLSYNRTTQADPGCVPLLLNSPEPAQVAYFDDIAGALRALEERDRKPEDFLRQNPHFKALDDYREREIRASSLLEYNGELLSRTRDAARHGQQALNFLLKRLRELRAPDELAAKSIDTFAALAALRMIRVLKRGFEWVDGDPEPWFESYKFNSDPCYCWFDWIPRRSDTGRRVFGYRLWAGARVGHERHYEYVMFPLKFVLPLFLDGVKGHTEGFYTWVLPQLFSWDLITQSKTFPSKTGKHSSSKVPIAQNGGVATMSVHGQTLSIALI